MTKPRLAHGLTALTLGLALAGTPALAAVAPPTPPAVPASRAGDDAAPAPAKSRARGYADREAAAPRAADFKGNGVGIYIGGSTLAVVLVIVLVVVLL
jgi:hypothetical protein